MSKEKAVAKQMKRIAKKNQAASTGAQKALNRIELAEIQNTEAAEKLLEAQVSWSSLV